MLVSSVSEVEWLRTLNTVPSWDPPANSALIIAPHPDDETLGPGGLIAHLRSLKIEVAVVAVTDGEKAYGPADSGLAAVRRIEQSNALSRLGVSSEKIVRFGLPDGEVAFWEPHLIERLVPLISPESHVFSTWKGDRHPDHEACGRAAEAAVSRAGATLTSYFFWTWHWSEISALDGVSLRRFPLADNLLRAKSEALLCHQSQLVRPEGSPILPESLLAPARRPFEVFAVA